MEFLDQQNEWVSNIVPAQCIAKSRKLRANKWKCKKQWTLLLRGIQSKHYFDELMGDSFERKASISSISVTFKYLRSTAKRQQPIKFHWIRFDFVRVCKKNIKVQQNTRPTKRWARLASEPFWAAWMILHSNKFTCCGRKYAHQSCFYVVATPIRLETSSDFMWCVWPFVYAPKSTNCLSCFHVIRFIC